MFGEYKCMNSLNTLNFLKSH